MPAIGLRTSCATTAANWPNLRQRRLLNQPLLSFFTCGDVSADGDVLIRLPAHVEERHDRRVHPVEVAILGAIAKFAMPDLAVGNGSPEFTDELFRVEALTMR
jgi:hypothetical protein